MYKPVLVEYAQDLPMLNAVRDITGYDLQVISRQQNNISYEKLRDAISPYYVGYHPSFETGILRKYDKPGFTDDFKYRELCQHRKLTEPNITCYANEAKYYLCTRDTYDPVVIARLLSNKTLVIMETPIGTDNEYDQSIAEFYRGTMVLVTTIEIPDIIDYWNNAKSSEASDLALIHYNNWIKKPLQLTVHKEFFELEKDQIADYISALPEDRFATMETAATYQDKKGNEVLKLSPTKGADSLPNITIIILAHPRSAEESKYQKLEQMIIKNNKFTSRYPADKIQYLEQRDHQNLRDIVEVADNDLIILMARNTIYLPHSYYAKVKLLEEGYDLVGSLLDAHYNLVENRSDCYTSKYPHPSSIAFHKRYFLEYPEIINPDDTLYYNRISNTVNVPFTYNCVQLDFNNSDNDNNHVSNEKTKHMHHKLFDWDTKTFINKLYRVLF